MSLSIGIQGLKQTGAHFRNAQLRWQRRKMRAMRLVLEELDEAAQDRLAGNPLHKRTGNLSRLGKKVERGGDVGKIGPQVPYGAIHEFGGTVKAKPGGWLAIPSEEVMTAAGVARGSPRDYDDTWFHRSGANLLLLQADATGGITLLFTMVKSVKIPARPYLAPALREKQGRITELIGMQYMTAIRGGHG